MPNALGAGRKRNGLGAFLHDVGGRFGEGLVSQYNGLKDLAMNPQGPVQDPFNYASNLVSGIYEGDSMRGANALVNYGKQAFSSPGNFAQFAGENVGPGEALKALSLMKGAGLGFGAMTAYHGSPHNFDKFDLGKIGTGEGAQAYGHGLYFAEDPKVAGSYASMSPAVGSATPRRFFQGKELTPGTPEYHAGTLLSQSGLTVGQARKEVQGWIDDASTWDAKRLADKGSMESLAGWKKTLEVLKQAKYKSEFTHMDSGHLYHVDIPDEHIQKMLDWDSPLSEQPEEIRKVLMKHNPLSNYEVGKGTDYQWHFYDKKTGYLDTDYSFKTEEEALKALGDPTGGDIYQAMSGGAHGPQQEQASKLLKSLGIPGIRYLDGGSRSAGKGTRNFVVFDPEIVKILNKE